jgi:hypothetical protein
VALAALAVSGAQVLTASAGRLSRLDAIRTPLGEPPYPPVPYGYASSQFDGTVEITGIVSTLEHPVRSLTIRNTGTRTIAGLQIAAAVELMSSKERLVLVPTRGEIFVSKMQPVTIAPGASATISPDVMSGNALQRIVAAAAGAHVQFFVAIEAVRDDSGEERRIRIYPLATRAREALGLEESPSLPRALVQIGSAFDRWQDAFSATLFQSRPGRDRAEIPRALLNAAPSDSVCRDERGRAFSPGSSVAIRDEPGRSARCDGGRWIEGRR